VRPLTLRPDDQTTFHADHVLAARPKAPLPRTSARLAGPAPCTARIQTGHDSGRGPEWAAHHRDAARGARVSSAPVGGDLSPTGCAAGPDRAPGRVRLFFFLFIFIFIFFFSLCGSYLSLPLRFCRSRSFLLFLLLPLSSFSLPSTFNGGGGPQRLPRLAPERDLLSARAAWSRPQRRRFPRSRRNHQAHDKHGSCVRGG